MENIVFFLTQHTPMIDFLFDQEGAALRASAVKPQLDRFLVEELKAERVFNNRWQANPDNQDSTALNYRMTIIPTGTSDKKFKEDDLLRYPNYFGNMRTRGEEEKKETKRFTYYNDTNLKVRLLFSPAAQGLKEVITKELLCKFFMRNNFGTRASKGFGAYYIDNNDDYYVNPAEAFSYRHFKITPSDLEKFKYRISKYSPNKDELRFYRLFKAIEEFYNYLKSMLVDYGQNQQYNYNNVKKVLGFSEPSFNSTAPTRMQSSLLFKPLRDGCNFTIYLISREKEVNLAAYLRSQNDRHSIPQTILQDFFNYVLNLDNKDFGKFQFIFDQLK